MTINNQVTIDVVRVSDVSARREDDVSGEWLSATAHVEWTDR